MAFCMRIKFHAVDCSRRCIRHTLVYEVWKFTLYVIANTAQMFSKKAIIYFLPTSVRYLPSWYRIEGKVKTKLSSSENQVAETVRKRGDIFCLKHVVNKTFFSQFFKFIHAKYNVFFLLKHPWVPTVTRNICKIRISALKERNDLNVGLNCKIRILFLGSCEKIGNSA